MVIKENKKKRNKSSIFLLPMLGINLDLFKSFYDVYYQSTNEDKNNKENKKIYLVYKTENINIELINPIINSIHYLNTYNLDGFTIIRYKVPLNYLKDFKLFCRGKYNSFSNEYKNLLLRSYKTNKTELEKILNTLPQTKEELAKRLNVNIDSVKEVYSIPDEIEETFSASVNYKLEI